MSWMCEGKHDSGGVRDRIRELMHVPTHVVKFFETSLRVRA